MKKFRRLLGIGALLVLLLLFLEHIMPQNIHAQESVDGYIALDSENPIQFCGSYIIYQGQKIELGPKAIYLDGSLSADVVAKYEYVYNDVKEALSASALTDGSEDSPMTVYIAPYVYWIDNPAAVDTVEKTDGYSVPYGMVINCKWLKLEGLTTNPYNVVFAGNRGQSHASNGNYTMFRFNGDGLNVENLTIGNYCSVDLTYELKTDLSYGKRTSTITQAQLADMSGDKLYANNCNFISRLNLDPIGGATRSLYNNCHFESTDDSLNGNAVYVGCDFDFYGNRPLYSSYNTGSVFLGCKFNCVVLNVEAEPYQYFTKEGGAITAVDCTYSSNFAIPFGIGWTKYPAKSLRCYQFNILHNGQQTIIGGTDAAETVDMTEKSVLNAYRISYQGKTYYNTYNLLKGSDGWDPLQIKNIITAAQADSIPTMLTVLTSADTIESGITTATLNSQLLYFYGLQDSTAGVSFSIDSAAEAYVRITDNHDGTCVVEGVNQEDESKEVTVYASTESGLKGAVEITVRPSLLEAPKFINNPVITNNKAGKLNVEYTLDLGTRADQSLISWYRCTDADGSNAVLVAMTRLDEPEYGYEITAGDIGYYIMAKVEPKDIRSNPGEGAYAIYSDRITVADVKAKNLYTDFKNFPVISQTQVIPGFWTVDCFRPSDTQNFGSWKSDSTVAPWVYGLTGNGCVGYGLYQGTQGARLMYTPVAGNYGDMIVKMLVDPAKTAGQGFGSAGQYMDICIKFDTTTLTGYGIRIIRTKAASNAVTFVLVKYENGQTTEISEEIISSCYATGCEITISVVGNMLTAHVQTPTAQLADQTAAGYVHAVDLSTEIISNHFGGVAIQHTGTTGTGGWQNTTMLHSIGIEWNGKNNQNPEYVVDNNQGEASSSVDENNNSNISAGENNDSDYIGTEEVTITSQTDIKTGDTNYVVVWVLLAMVSLAGSILLIANRKNEKIEKNIK